MTESQGDAKYLSPDSDPVACRSGEHCGDSRAKPRFALRIRQRDHRGGAADPCHLCADVGCARGPRHRRSCGRAAAGVHQCLDRFSQRSGSGHFPARRVRRGDRHRRDLSDPVRAGDHRRARAADHRGVVGLSRAVGHQPRDPAAAGRRRAGLDDVLGTRQYHLFARAAYPCSGHGRMAPCSRSRRSSSICA